MDSNIFLITNSSMQVSSLLLPLHVWLIHSFYWAIFFLTGFHSGPSPLSLIFPRFLFQWRLLRKMCPCALVFIGLKAAFSILFLTEWLHNSLIFVIIIRLLFHEVSQPCITAPPIRDHFALAIRNYTRLYLPPSPTLIHTETDQISVFHMKRMVNSFSVVILHMCSHLFQMNLLQKQGVILSSEVIIVPLTKETVSQH